MSVILVIATGCGGSSSGNNSGSGGTGPGGGSGGTVVNVRGLGLGAEHGCFINGAWEALCWGYNFWGQVGLPSSSGLNITNPNLIVFPAGKHLVRKIVAGRAHTCAIIDDSVNNIATKVYCWGSNEFGQLGDDSSTGLVSSVPKQVDFSDAVGGTFSIKKIVDLVSGDDHICAAIDFDFPGSSVRQEIWCWGKNDRAQIGFPANTPPLVKKPMGRILFVTNELAFDIFKSSVTGNHTQVVSMAAGSSHTCVELTNPISPPGLWVNPNWLNSPFSTGAPKTYCWGRNLELQLGYNGMRPQGTTLFNFDSPGQVQQVDLAQVAGWPSFSPGGALLNPSIGFSDRVLYAGAETTCVVSRTSSATEAPKCWGNNQHRQVTINPATSTRFPTPSSIGAIRQNRDDVMAIGKNHLCGISNLVIEQVKCLGSNLFGQIGIGMADNFLYSAQQDVKKLDGSDLDGMDEIQAGDFFSCAHDSQQVYCWGDNSRGQIGVNPSIAFVPHAQLLGGISATTIMLPRTGQIACYNIVGTIIACAGSGQDGDTLSGVAWPSQRFTDNMNGTITDELTGLKWAQDAHAPGPAACSPNVFKNWQQALFHIGCLNTTSYLGFNDWRLPNIVELESLGNAQDSTPTVWLSGQGFSNVLTETYWSSTTIIKNKNRAWGVLMRLSLLQNTSLSNKTVGGSVWPVRGATALPAKLWQTGQAECYDVSGAVVACGGTGQDGDTLAGVSQPSTRFIDNLDETVNDDFTGLMWTRDAISPGPVACNPGTRKSWQEALDYAACLNANNYLTYNDWRLPNRKEIFSITDFSTADPAFPSSPFINVPTTNGFWTSTSDISEPDKAWFAGAQSGALNSNPKTFPKEVWPVRTQ